MRALLLVLVLLLAPSAALAEPDWAVRLAARLGALESRLDGELGVAVRPLDGGTHFGWRADEAWYLASLVKVPVAIELMARVEAGTLSLDERLALRAADYVDGAGPTNWAPPGSELALGALLEAMLTESDNTATDLLIRRLGVAAVNRRARALIPPRHGPLGPITPLVEVRRHLYRQLHPRAAALTGLDFIELHKQESDADRLTWLVERLDLAPAALHRPSLDAAFDAYYASGLNSGRLDAMAELLAALGEGRALGKAATGRLLAVMARTRRGERRLEAGFGPGIRFAHKTGTQRRRACDAGIASRQAGDDRQRVAIVACVRGAAEARAERALAAVGRALRETLFATPTGAAHGSGRAASQSRK
ncbi:serine hydrolase [Billgrantia azerbaijanica]|nr:serine hydrolase [Halomonas azerbaijanica]